MVPHSPGNSGSRGGVHRIAKIGVRVGAEGFARAFPCPRACSAQIFRVLVKNSVPVVCCAQNRAIEQPLERLKTAPALLIPTNCMVFRSIRAYRAEKTGSLALGGTTGTVFLTKTPKS